MCNLAQLCKCLKLNIKIFKPFFEVLRLFLVDRVPKLGNFEPVHLAPWMQIEHICRNRMGQCPGFEAGLRIGTKQMERRKSGRTFRLSLLTEGNESATVGFNSAMKASVQYLITDVCPPLTQNYKRLGEGIRNERSHGFR